MKIAVIIIAVVIVLVLIYIAATYNTLVKLRNSVEEAFATMDVYLKKRWDLIPNIVASVKGYAKHEADTLLNVISARNSRYQDVSVEDKMEADREQRIISLKKKTERSYCFQGSQTKFGATASKLKGY